MRASRDARKRNQLSLQRTEVRGQVQFVFIAAELDVAVVHSHTSGTGTQTPGW